GLARAQAGREGGLGLGGPPLLEALHLESRKERRELAGSEQEGLARRSPAERALSRREGLVEEQSARGQPALDRGRERAVEVAEDEDRCEGSARERRSGLALEVDGEDLDA